MRRKALFSPAVKILVLALVSLVVYANTLDNEFVTDDIPTIVANRGLGNLSYSLEYLKIPSLLPLTLTANYFVGGLNPAVYHLTNILFHTLATLAAYFVLKKIFSEKLAFATSLLFAVHPVHIEAVSWVSGRPYPASSLFVFLCLLFFIKAVEKDKLWPFCYLSLLSFVIALFFSVFTIITPFLLGLYLLVAKTPSGRSSARDKIFLLLPYFAVALFYFLAINSLIQERLEFLNPSRGLAQSLRNPFYWVPIQLTAFLYVFLLPSNISYIHIESLDSRVTSWPVSASIAVIFLLFLFYSYRKSKEVFFALGFLLLTLSPILIPLQVGSIFADRYGYLPSLGYCLLLAFLIFKLVERLPLAVNKNLLSTGFIAAMVLTYSFLTVWRNEDWQNEGTLWEAAIYSSPKSAKAHSGLGLYYLKQGDINEGIFWLEKALALNPLDFEANWTLGLAYYLQAHYEGSVAYYQRSIEINPGLPFSHYGLALSFLELGKNDLAKNQLKEALRLNPAYVDARLTLGNVYLAEGDGELAKKEFEEALRYSPSDPELKEKINQLRF